MRLGGGVHAVGLVETSASDPFAKAAERDEDFKPNPRTGGFLAVAEPPDVIRKEQVVVFRR